MNEKDIINQIKEFLKTLEGCFFWKEHGGQFGQAGIPDLIICYRGRFVALEVKTATGKLTTLQGITLRRIQNAGGTAAVVRSVEEARAVIAKI